MPEPDPDIRPDPPAAEPNGAGDPPAAPPEPDIVAQYRARQRDRQEAREWQRLGAAGVEFAGSILLFGLAGWGIDHLLGTVPWGLIIGLLLGCVVGMFLLIRTGLKSFR